MANRGCADLELDESKYSSPMPFIGLYIAAGSLLCFLAMLSDISSALLRKRRWLPCRLFTLNSVSLTLLAIAAKLPVDLTASMPSNLDQFSKLSGMTFICISMGFLSPSLGINQKSETMSNMIALSIMVVTVIVNICIQIRTRVILLFVTEHIIVMLCMLGLLASLWLSSVAVAYEKNYSLDNNKDILRKGRGSMLERLKLAYLYGFNSNPQFILCKFVGLYTVAGACTLCSVVLIQAAFRNLSVGFCDGKSDYGWSMWVIVAVQTLTILVGCVAVVFRCVAMSLKIKLLMSNQSAGAQASSEIGRCPELRYSSKGRCKFVLYGFLSVGGGIPILILFCLPFMLLMKATRFIIDPCLKKKQTNDEDMGEYKHLPSLLKYGKGMEEWVVVKSVNAMKRWIEISEGYSPKHLLKLLRETVPSSEDDYAYLVGRNVSTLSLALLARIAQVSLPAEDAGQSLVEAYSEACEILEFIEGGTKSKTFQSVYASQIAKAVRKGNGYGSFLEDFTIPATHPLDRAIATLTILQKTSFWKEIGEEAPRLARFNKEPEYWKEVVLLLDFLLIPGRYSSIDDLSKQIQKLFVDMFHVILAQLPHAIYNNIVDSTAEEFHLSVGRSLGVLCQVRSLQHSIRWSYPVGLNQLWPGLGEENIQEPLEGLADSFLSLDFV